MATKRRYEVFEGNELELSSHNVDHLPSTENEGTHYLESGGAHFGGETFTQYWEQRGNWIAYFDWNTNCFYYQNINNNTVQWEQPVEWENVPSQYATEFNDYSCLTENYFVLKTEWEYSSKDDLRRRSEEIESKNREYLKRAAKRQMDPKISKNVHWIPEGATEYNIWYDRWIGEHWGRERTLEPAETRCVVETDAGYTKANVGAAEKSFFCIYFARGCCKQGVECGYLHLVPTNEDEKRISLAYDVFGRERHRSHKDDMGGVGSFDKDCRTLYVGGLGCHKDLEKILWKEFGEFGEIEDIRVLPKRHIAFVRYRNRVNAEFSKIAMMNQKLDNREMLNVRWAFDDPAPSAIKRESNQKKQRLLDAAESRGLVNHHPLQPVPPTGVVTAPYPTTPKHQPAPQCGPMTKEQIEQEEKMEQAKVHWSRLDQVLKVIEGSNQPV